MTMEFNILVLIALIFTVCVHTCTEADESPGFFLKITKNVPRLGKRTIDREYDSYFMKNIKTIPRIGRSDFEHNDFGYLISWLWNTPIRQPNKRRLANQILAERELSVVQPVNSNTLIELLNRDAIPSDHVKFVHWKDFDRALLADAELYAKVISLGRKPDQSLKEDLKLNKFIPLFSNSNDNAADFMLYNKDDRDLYGGGQFEQNFLQYNHL